MGKPSKDRRDIYYRKAKENGYRARSAYKLLHLDLKFDLFNNVKRVVDLCAAPGSWSQVACQRLVKAASLVDDPPLIVAVDLQEMAPIDGVKQVQGDITAQETSELILGHFSGQPADLIICDGAPDVTGMHDMDEYLQSQLLMAALMLTTRLLKEGGTFVAKVFRGENVGLLEAQLFLFFEEVWCCKPASSRNSSLEAFVVCRQFRLPEGYNVPDVFSFEEFCEPSVCFPVNARIAPFLACGDLNGYDSDMNYELEGPFVPSVQPPIHPPYENCINAKRGK